MKQLSMLGRTATRKTPQRPTTVTHVSTSVERRLRAAGIVRRNYLTAWLREMRSGKDGQRLDRPSTWKYDELWLAAVYEERAREAESLLASAMSHGALSEAVEPLVDDVEREWRNAHRAMSGELRPSWEHHNGA